MSGSSLNRRQFLGASAAAFSGISTGWTQSLRGASTWTLRITEQPDLITAYCGDAQAVRQSMSRMGSQWGATFQGASVEVLFEAGAAEANVSLHAPVTPIQRLHLRWRRSVPQQAIVFGDAWERSYGDLAWLPLAANRPLPWYMLVHHNGITVGAGVKPGAAAFAFWQADSDGISLWLDVRNGGNGVLLGKRNLQLATLIQHENETGQSAWEAALTLCRRMAANVRRTAAHRKRNTSVIFGSNDWYYAHGRNTAEGILRDAELVARLAPAGATQPFTVIDDGYQDSKRFPSMIRLAEGIRGRGVRPGIWIRPLRPAADAPEDILLPDARWGRGSCEKGAPAYDPTVPEGLEAALATVKQACDWGYDLIKHDFTTWEMFGQWGREMGASPTLPGWHFNDHTQTNAEIVAAFYQELRNICGDERLILGCNTVGHLAVGVFDVQRTGDDVSSETWDRTRRMGVNTLAFRLPQHGVFFTQDPDCVPITAEVPWEKTKQWLNAVADSGTVLLISAQHEATGPEQQDAIRRAFAQYVSGTSSEPLDWLTSCTPDMWRSRTGHRRYSWLEIGGASPFPV
jgi:alpha-galactosidase